jgi:hypothetical protein
MTDMRWVVMCILPSGMLANFRQMPDNMIILVPESVQTVQLVEDCESALIHGEDLMLDEAKAAC